MTDVNDNPPYFLNPEPQVNVVEEDRRDLPSSLVKVSQARGTYRINNVTPARFPIPLTGKVGSYCNINDTLSPRQNFPLFPER